MRPFELEYEDPGDGENRYPEIRLRGCFDAHSVQRFENVRMKLMDAGACDVILDLEELDYISSAGMGSIMAFFQFIRRQGGNMVILRPSRRVMDLLHMLGFSKLFPIADSRASAGDLLSAERRL